MSNAIYKTYFGLVVHMYFHDYVNNPYSSETKFYPKRHCREIEATNFWVLMIQ
jgi:hypothetical protein